MAARPGAGGGAVAAPGGRCTVIDSDLAVSATGLLRRFNELGVLAWADVHPALHLCHLYGERDERVALAVALTVRALRAGSLCVDLTEIAQAVDQWERPDETGEAPLAVPPDAWPEAASWLAAVTASPAVGVGDQAPPGRPLRLADGLLYLERSFADQETVRSGVLALLSTRPAPLGLVPEGASADPRSADQDAAVASALTAGLTVIAGGPGTGKTHVVARIVAAFTAGPRPALVALAAPTGKAAARMTESLRRAVPAGPRPLPAAATVHRLLGSKPGSRTRFRHDATNPLPHDVVIVDEVSMVSMTLMARLLSALKPTARLVLVGDPDQLASVEAGAVLADLTGATTVAPAVVRLRHNFRFAGVIQELASAIREGDADRTLAVLDGPDAAVRLVPPDRAGAELRGRCVAAGGRVFAAAARADGPAALAELDAHRLLCAHRRGPFGIADWSRTVRSWLVEDVPGFDAEGEFHVGRPLMMTSNAPDLGLYNGDTGVVLAGAGQPDAVFATGAGPRHFSPYLLDGLQTVHAMTIHKSQGSQFRRVSVVLPPVGSPLLTRELLYTAVTRASDDVLLVGTPDAVRAAIARPAARTSGLRGRLDAGASDRTA
nr:exodeoxyribonuclease V subunit alpha [Propionibacterium sp.]